MEKKDLTKEDVLHLGELANLKLTDDEVEKITIKLSETLKYVENLHELDTKSISPTNEVTNQKDVFFEDGIACERMLTQDEALANAKEKRNKYFVVKRINIQ